MDVTAPFVDQAWVGVLSELNAVVSSVRSASWARTMLCPIRPASSRSELVMEPSGFSHDTSWEEISGGKRKRHRIGPSSSAAVSTWGRSSGMTGSGHRCPKRNSAFPVAAPLLVFFASCSEGPSNAV